MMGYPKCGGKDGTHRFRYDLDLDDWFCKDCGQRWKKIPTNCDIYYCDYHTCGSMTCQKEHLARTFEELEEMTCEKGTRWYRIAVGGKQ